MGFIKRGSFKYHWQGGGSGVYSKKQYMDGMEDLMDMQVGDRGGVLQFCIACNTFSAFSPSMLKGLT